MILRRKTRPSDASNVESVSGRSVQTSRASDGYTYAETSDTAVIKGLQRRGYVASSSPGPAIVRRPVGRGAEAKKQATADRIISERSAEEIVQHITAGWMDAILNEIMISEVTGKSRVQIIDAAAARSDILAARG